MEHNIKLGQTVKDLVTGYEGIAENIAYYLHGCDSVNVQAKMKEDGTIPKSLMVDVAQLVVTDNKQIIEAVMPTEKIKLGQKIKNPVTGMVGIAYGRALYLNGCSTICLQPPIDKDGKHVKTNWFQEEMLEIVEDEPVVKTGNRNTGGPCPSIPCRDI